MKYIEKQVEPPLFTDWKALANDNWQPTYDDLSGNEKKAVKQALMAEQGYICCYCERQLIDNDSHIEHFKPQSDPSVDPLDYSNLLCSCQDQLEKGEPRHCGNLKEDWFDSELLISPLYPECEKRFTFSGIGNIEPTATEDLAASETIKKLGLNIPKLRDMRSKVLEPFLDDSLSEKEIGKFVTGYLQKDDNGQYGEFFTTIQYLFRDYVAV
jgi:uncharacterized protein (TIGR02646 family)